ncbi:molybdate ABC transporter substrate-binding protein [Anderseniella sp. Alg231-50]|uniref:molybdate ABC transporter substrate-binding protein n=1 Tax=Anderseniella sp. Alg231-50 TaxID=1922226 RepID=UPI000D561CC2
MKKIALNWLVAGMILMALSADSARAGEVVVAVATNFLLPARDISAVFEEDTGHSVVLVAGATGKLATQILAGAPFDVFLAADQARPRLLIDKKAAVAGSRFTYATGTLVLWSRDRLPLTGTELGSLDVTGVSRIAMANPKLAPYGLAAEQALDRLDLLKTLAGRFVYGENIGQTFAMAASRNVTAGLIAKSQLASLPENQKGHWIDVPDTLHEPILQDGVLIMRAENNPVARSFMNFMKSDRVAGIISRFGYGVSRP